MTDSELAAAIQVKVNELNSAIAAAQKAGLLVGIGVTDITSVSSAYPEHRVFVSRVSRTVSAA